MAKQGSVRIGPVSILVLIIILCLAVMAVLTLITSEAEESITVRQEESTTAFYANEAEAGIPSAFGWIACSCEQCAC